jgi:hypothetical protein
MAVGSGVWLVRGRGSLTASVLWDLLDGLDERYLPGLAAVGPGCRRRSERGLHGCRRRGVTGAAGSGLDAGRVVLPMPLRGLYGPAAPPAVRKARVHRAGRSPSPADRGCPGKAPFRIERAAIQLLKGAKALVLAHCQRGYDGPCPLAKFPIFAAPADRPVCTGRTPSHVPGATGKPVTPQGWIEVISGEACFRTDRGIERRLRRRSSPARGGDLQARWYPVRDAEG